MIRELFLSNFSLSSCVWQSTIFIVVGLVSSFILRHRSARAHQVLFLAMIAAVIVPMISILVKHYELGVFVAEPVVMQSQAEDRAIASNYGASGVILAENIEHNPGLIEKDLPSATLASETTKFPWRSVVLYGWIAASLILATRLVVTFVLGVRLLGRALPLECQRIKEAVHQAGTKLGIDKDVTVRSSQGVRCPVIWCWRRRPILLVPSAAGRFDNGVDWAGVLCHELAHWKRRDHISGLLAELAVCILPWHPLLWWAKSRLVRLSEQACDDWVVASGQPGTDYAESLLDLTPQGQMAFVPAVVSSKRGLAGRVRRILKDSCGNPRTGAIWALAVSVVVVCLAVGVAFAKTRPAETEAATEQKPLMVQKLFKLEHHNSSQMAQIIRPLLSNTGHISADERTNNLLIIDTVENLKRIEKIIAQFDVSKVGQTVTEIFEIRYANPVEIVELLKKLINGPPGFGSIIEPGKEPIVLVPEPRRKWIIAKASPENIKQIGEWIKKLDISKSIGMDPADAAAYEQLETIVDLSDLAPGMSFGEVVDKLENSVEPPLQIQPIWKDLLENAEVEQATPAGMDPLSRIKLRKALEILLTGVSSIDFAKLTYIVDEGVILIGTVDMLPPKMVHRVYDISDLVETAPDAAKASPENIKQIAQLIEKLDTRNTIGIDPIDKAVYEQLETIVDLSDLAPGMHFGEVVEKLENSVEPPLQIQPIWKDLLENSEVEQATPAGMDPLSRIKLRKALEILIASVSSTELPKLTYIVDEGVILIRTVDMLPPKMVHRVYDISDLIETAADADALIRRITETIEPDSWYKLSNKGEGTIMAYPALQPKKLAVMQTYKIHQQITRFLEDTRSSRDELRKTKPEIMIETVFLSVSEDYLKDVGLDANTANFSNGWTRHLAAKYPAGPNGQPYGLIIDDLHVRFLLRTVQAHHDSKALVAPRVRTRAGTTAEIGIIEEYRYIKGYNEPNSPSEEPQPKRDKVTLGPRIWLTPKLTDNNRNVNLDLKLEMRQLEGIIEGKYKGKYPYYKPIIDVISAKMPCTIPDGKIMLIGGLKINEQIKKEPGTGQMRKLFKEPSALQLKDLPLIGAAFSSKDKAKDQKMLLILVKPIINPQQKAKKILPGQADSEEHLKSLARQLEKSSNVLPNKDEKTKSK